MHKYLSTFLKEKKVKSIPLKVSAPFHCSLMKPAAEKNERKNKKINFCQSKYLILFVMSRHKPVNMIRKLLKIIN